MTPLYVVTGWIVVVAFAITFIVTILALLHRVTKVTIDPKYLKWLFTKMILEIIAGGFFLFYTGVAPISDVPDISGTWEYKCTQHGGGNEWGGVAMIRQERTPYGLSFRISGQRDWSHYWNEKKDTTEKINPPFSWNTNWGWITGKDQIKFTYEITTVGGTIQGYAVGAVAFENGRPSSFSGSFYQLPPYQSLFGGMDFRKTKDFSDRKWIPKLTHEN